MSAYSETTTQLTDGELIVEALKELGFTPRVCIGKPEQLEGYHGDKRQQRADIIIPRAQVQASANDIGFARGPDGKYTVIISEYDSHRYNAEWLKKLRVTVAQKGIERQAKRAGLKLTSKKAHDGKLIYNFIKQ